jgi:sugar phosphate isomerase/epimerase
MLATVGEDYSTLDSIAATGGVRPDATWPATLRRAARVAELAGHERIHLVTVHAGFIPHGGDDPARPVLLERLRTVADLFEAKGVRLAFETGQEEAGTLLRALDDLRRPEVGVNFDPANMILYGMGDPVAALRTLRARVRQIHIKDAVPSPERGRWGNEVVAGTGAVDWKAFFEVVQMIDPAVDLVIEREAGATREEDVRAAARLVRRHAAGRPVSL